MSVLIIQFLKGRADSGEVVSAKRLPGVKVEQYGSDKLVKEDDISESDRALARKALERAKAAIRTGEVNLLILDEINVALHFGMISVKEVLDLIDSRPPEMELVLTGRYAKPEVVAKADYVTEMTPKKHPYDSGKEARSGIEC